MKALSEKVIFGKIICISSIQLPSVLTTYMGINGNSREASYRFMKLNHHYLPISSNTLENEKQQGEWSPSGFQFASSSLQNL